MRISLGLLLVLSFPLLHAQTLLTPPATSQTPISGTAVRSINVGGGGDDSELITGRTEVFPDVPAVSGTGNNKKFNKHRWGLSFLYTVPVAPSVTYDVNLHFADAKGGCNANKRILNATVYGDDITTGKRVVNLKVFDSVGCKTAAYTVPVAGIDVGAGGKLTLAFEASAFNAMVSSFDIVTSDPNYVPPDSPSPVRMTVQESVTVNVGAGDAQDIEVAGTTISTTAASVTGTASATAAVYKTARSGTDFTYTFNLSPGAYDIVLGFAEFTPQFCSASGKRVFNVFVNGMVQLEGFDIFGSAGKCFKGVEQKITYSVGAVDTKPLTIRFDSIVDSAQVNYISVKPAKQACVPVSDTGGFADGADHAAHSVPGTYPPQLNANSPKSYTDNDGDGFHVVDIDGSASHTHFFDSANDVIGELTSYRWNIVETGELLSTKVSFSYKFPMGTTRIKLTVMDNSCTTDEAETTVTVTQAIQPGMYCYFYNGLTQPLKGGTALTSVPAPGFAVEIGTPNLGFPSFPFDTALFAMKCFLFLQTDINKPAASISLSAGAGNAKLFKGEDVILDTAGSNVVTTALPVGLTGFEIIYQRTGSTTPSLSLKVDGSVPAASKIFHDRRTVLPVVTKITPSEGPDVGGTQVKVEGYGLFQPLVVTFGGKNVAVGSGALPTSFTVTSPAVGTSALAPIVATSAAGLASAPINFSYGSSCDSIGFTETTLSKAGGGPVDNLELPTCAVYGGDGKIYMGTLGGSVQAISYDVDTLTVNSHCYSKEIKDTNFLKNGSPSQRDILGIAFDPRDKSLSPYVSTSTLFWRSKGRIDLDNKAAWRNGAIERLKPGSDPSDAKVCLVYDKRIVTGVPVCNHDHAVNGLLFTQGGDLLIAVGGFTNAGLPGYKLGNFWETTLSSAILIAKLSKPGFDGTIVYSNPDTPRLATVLSGDVSTYCTGLRNTFAMTMTGSGGIYASDQGPNCSFGNTASTCGDYVEADAAAYDVDADIDWPGKVNHGPADCPTGIGRPDKMVHITPGSWYGHANIQRGGKECAWIDPFDDKTADDKAAPAGYKKPLVTLKSPITGMQEYRSQHFCGKLRGELILSTHGGGKTYRMGVDGNTKLNGPDVISSTGGITFVETPSGDLVFPRLTAKIVFVMRPKTTTAGLFVANAVPFRHGGAGGTKIVVGGSGFGTGVGVKIGGATCVVSKSSDKEISCTVPSGSGLKDLVVTSGGVSATLAKAVLYM